MSTLRNIGYIVQKEWRHYFASPIAYAALTIWAFLVGFFYFVNLYEFLQRSAMMAMRGGMYRPSLNDGVIGDTIYSMAVVALFIMPMVTMRLFAEEKRQGTIELLATSPLTDLELVLGKFFGALALFGVMIATGFVSFGWVWWYADAGAAPDWRPLLTGGLALALVGGAFIAVGLFISSLSRNQIVAGAATFAVLLVFWLLSVFEQFGGGYVASFLSYLGLVGHIRDLIRGIIDLKDVVFYLSVIIFGLFLAQQSMESQRWRA